MNSLAENMFTTKIEKYEEKMKSRKMFTLDDFPSYSELNRLLIIIYSFILQILHISRKKE